MIQRHTFSAMGTTVELLVQANPGAESSSAFAAAESEFERLEALLSRFRGDSELSALNRSGSLLAGPDLFRVTELALDARERTNGRFDPTVHDALVAAGYDRSFERLHENAPAALPSRPCGGRVDLDHRTGRIELEPAVRLDLGGIAKGYAVDRACDFLTEAGPCLVNAGGDLAVRGGSWPVGLETPDGPLTLELSGGAIATSGRDRRRWRRAGEEHHHLIDPATGRPAESDLVTATVVAGTTVEAEVHATSLFLSGLDSAVRAADEGGLPCVLVSRNGRTVLGGGLG